MASRRRLFLVGLLAALVGVGPAYQQNATHAERGLALAREGKLEAAESELRTAAARAPTDSEVLTALGAVLAMQHKLEESSEVFRKALKIRPADLITRRYLAANLWQLHLYREAKENLQFILKRQPNDKGSRLLLGMVCENSGDYATAVHMLSSVPEEVRKQPQSVAALARSYYHSRQREKARATLALLSPSGPSDIFLGAQIADEMHDYETAERLFQSIESTYPDRVQLTYSLALVAYHSERYAESQKILQRLVDSPGKTSAALNLLGWCYHKQGRTAEAGAALEEAIKLEPSDVNNYLDETKILLAQHSLPSALQSARRTAGVFPKAAIAFELQGTVEQAMGQFADAVQSFNKAVQLDPSRPDGWLGLAPAQSAAGMSSQAHSTFENGIKRFPNNTNLKVGYADLLLKEAESGDATLAPKAAQLLGSALALDPSLPDAHYQLGNLALKNGRLAQAQSHLEQAVKLDASNHQTHFALARLYRRQGRKQDADREMAQYEKLKENRSSQ
jgi:tetratricopeptide (TPR) repeat protein